MVETGTYQTAVRGITQLVLRNNVRQLDAAADAPYGGRVERRQRRGLVAEWLRRGLQILAPRFDSGRGLQPFPHNKSMAYAVANFAYAACHVAFVLQPATVDSQGFPLTSGKSVRHERDMKRQGQHAAGHHGCFAQGNIY